jgi:hypothetical protein
MRTKLAVLAGGIAIAAAACSSAPSTTSGTETITGTVTGAAAVKSLSSDSAALTFPVFTYTGPVSTTVSNYALPGGNNNAKTATDTLKTSVGDLTITHTRTFPADANQLPAPSATTRSGNVCIFTINAENGTYVVKSGTGQFKGATGSGKYSMVIHLGATLPAGKTTCSVSDYGANGPNPVPQGTSFVFKASGPLTVSS